MEETHDNQSITVDLSGDVSLTDFADAMVRFQRLVTSLSREIGGAKNKVDWRVDDLQIGSAIATIQGFSEHPEITESIVRGFGVVGKSLQNNEPIPYSSRVRKDAQAFAGIVKGSITSLRFETASSDAVVFPVTQSQQSVSIVYSFGEVRGTVETLMKRRGLRFTLYDEIFDRPVSCYLEADQQEMIRDIWGKKVVVSGEIGRNSLDRRPVVMRQIRSVVLLDEVYSGRFEDARGILGPDEDGLRSEDIIRSIRDGW